MHARVQRQEAGIPYWQPRVFDWCEFSRSGGWSVAFGDQFPSTGSTKTGTYSGASGSPSWAAQRQQQLRPPGPADRVAVQLAAAETARLREADLWYVDEVLCAATERLPATSRSSPPNPRPTR